MAILEEETSKRFGYYPYDLKSQSHKKILAACDKCGKIREIRRGDYCTLCGSCRIKGRPHSGENAPNWKGGKVQRQCVECGKIFDAHRYKIKRGEGKYCSYSCSNKAGIRAQRHNLKPQKTKPERIFEDICRNNGLPFRFVGDGTLWLGCANPDFIHGARKLCVEIFGDYWHSPLLNCGVKYKMTVDGRRKQLKAEGYKLIVIWESDLKRKDAEEFVLKTLRKQKVI